MTQNKPEKSALFSKFKWRIKLGVFSCYNLHFKHLLQKAFETFTKLPISLITPWQHWTIAMIIKNIKGWKRPQYPFHNKKKVFQQQKTCFHHPPTDGAAEDFTTSGDKMAERSEQPETAAREPKNTITLE